MTELSTTEAQELNRCEAVIEAGLQTFVEVGMALLKIRDGRLYRESHDTFQNYCRDRWAMSRQRANQLVDAAKVMENLTTIVVKPATESQARPLVGLAPDQQRQVWSQAIETAPNSKITAEHVKATVDEMFPARQSLPGQSSFLDALEDDQSDSWSECELRRKALVEAGQTVTANLRDDSRLISWAQEKGIYERIDRQTDWGNPFVEGKDGTREEVIAKFEAWLPTQPELMAALPELKGKVLGCWCHPEPCHGDVLIQRIEGEATVKARPVSRPTLAELLPADPPPCGPDYDVMQGDAEHLPFPDESFDLVLGSPPYLDARLYLENGQDLGIARDCAEWVEWMLEVTTEALRVSRGLVVWVVGAKTEDRTYQPGPEGLLWEWWKRGGSAYRPCYWHRPGIPGSGGDQWFASRIEYVLAFKRPGPLPWADPLANGHPPVYGPGGEMSHRNKDGSRVNSREGYQPPAFANPGNLISTAGGGGHLGNDLAHLNEAPFPEELAAWFIRSHCPPGGRVLDPFGGSGSTVAAALKERRRGVSLDLRESQCRLARQRLASPPEAHARLFS
jgi:hypothetical protein